MAVKYPEDIYNICIGCIVMHECAYALVRVVVVLVWMFYWPCDGCSTDIGIDVPLTLEWMFH